MYIELSTQNLQQIKNPQFRRYAQIYTDISKHFLKQIQEEGLDLSVSAEKVMENSKPKLEAKGVNFRNNNKSITLNWISSACEACRKGENSQTFYLSLQCHRKCYYCFNPNQEDYMYFANKKRDCLSELDSLARSGRKLAFIALTGGEPLLHKEDTIKFFARAKERFPKAHTRLYTSGDLLEPKTLEDLKNAELDEIRFSIKLEDGDKLRKKVLDNIILSKDYIPNPVVEMPVIPGTLKEMKDLLRELDRIGIAGINLLEFCFPYNNVQEFKRRGMQIKNPPFKVLYNYWYAGGLPVAGSEKECLALLEYALDEKLKIGIHYCSLENKHTGQVFQQNNKERISQRLYFSNQDFFLKTAKVFGEDIPDVLKVFKKNKVTNYRLNEEHQFLEFNVREIELLKKLPVEVGISFNIREVRNGESVLRELKLDLVHPSDFNIGMI